MKSIIIVGGGISGLAAAFHLQEHLHAKETDLACTLIEGQKKPGGKIFTEKLNGFIIEAGPDSFITQKPWALELCHKMGLKDRLIPTNQNQKNIYIFSGDKLHLLPEGMVLLVPTRLMPLLRSSLLSPIGKLRMALDLFIPPRKDAGDESLAAFVRRRLGREALNKIVEPLMAGIYAGQAEALSLKSTFPRFKDLEREYGSLIRGLIAKRREAAREEKAEEKAGDRQAQTLFMSLREGMGEFVETLVSRLNQIRLMTGKQVRSIRLAGQTGPAYQVELEDGTSVLADVVILTTPAFVTADLIDSLNPSLGQALREIPYVSTATISLAYKRSQCPHPLDGYGFVVPRTEGRNIMACTWTSTKFPHRAPAGDVLIRCFVGGAGQEPLVHLDDHAMIRMIREELETIMGIESEPVLTRIYRWERGNPQYTVGHLERLAAIEGLIKGHPGLFLTGSAYYGVGIPDCIHEGTRIAQQALQFLNTPSAR